jgi:hypothetical protein
MKLWGCVYVLVAVLAGFSSLSAMMAGVNGSTQSWWTVFALGAAILLFADGIKLCFLGIRGAWLVSSRERFPLRFVAHLENGQ